LDNLKTKHTKVLIVDDEKETRDIFTRQLKDFYDLDTADSAIAAVQKLEQQNFQIVFTDLVMPNENGIQLLKKIKSRWPHISVVVISGKATIGMAVEAMKLGAEELIEKPVEDLDLLNIVIEKIMKTKWQSDEIKRLRKKLDDGFNRKNIIGKSIQIQQIMDKVKKVSPLDASVLISGETGVGKEVFADLIYRNSSRSEYPFVAVNCGSLPESLLESALFGHKKGAFTGALKDKMGYFKEADGGTLFLDEITETTPAFQVKLLRVLESGIIRHVGDDKDVRVDVRIIAASNKNIEEEVEKGEFRQDLYYRLNVIKLNIPPLRERHEDIKLLAKTFVDEFAEKYKKGDLAISEPAMAIIISSEWKGNVRELKNAMEHSVALAEYDKILPEDLPENIFQQNSFRDKSVTQYFDITFSDAKDKFEKKYIERLMLKYNGDVTSVAKFSGIHRQNLYEKFKKHDLDPDKYREDN